MRDYIDAACVRGLRNLDGRLAVTATAGLPLLLREGVRVHFVPPVLDSPRSAVVASVAPQGPGSAVVAFEGIGDATAAEALVGCHCLVARGDAEEAALDAQDAAFAFALSGWTFEDATSGRRGRVVSAEEMPSQLLLAVVLDGEGEAAGCQADEDEPTHLVPLVDDFVMERDEARRHLALALPQGIFAL